MSVRTDVVNLLVNVGGDKAKDQLNQLRKKAAELSSEMKGLSKNTTEFKEKSKELSLVNDQMASLRKTIGLTALSQKELTAELKRLQALKNVTTPQTKEFNELQESINKVSGRLWEVKNGVFGVAAVFKKLKDEIGGFGIGALAALGAQFIMGKISTIIDGAGKLSDQLADLQRVTGMTANETDKLNASLKQIDSRTSNGTLREIAIVAAKLGLSGKPLAEFTEQFDKLMVVLGSELGSADEAATTLGKILNVFEGEITGDNISHLGNAIVELANKGVASAPFISDFTQRVAGVAKSSDMSLGATVGLAAGFEELGLRSESSATALQKLLMTIGADVPKAAKIAGMEGEKFNELFAKAPQEALIKYGEGLVKNKTSFAEITSSFKDAGEEGARVVQTLQLLGKNGEFLREKIDLGNESMKSATGINEAFAIKNENLAATMAKMSKEFDRLMSSSAVTDFLKGAVNGTSELIKGLIALPKWINENKALIILMAGAVGVYTRARTAQFLLDQKDLILKGLLYAKEQASFILFGAQLYITKAYTIAKGLLTGQITLATIATNAFNVASNSLSGIVGIIITVISLAAAAYSSFSTKVKESGTNLTMWADLMKEASQNAGKEIAQMKLLFNAINDVNKPIEERRANYEKLQTLYPDILKNMSFEEAAAGRLKGKYDELTQAIMGKYIVQASESQFAKLGEELMKVEQQISTAKNALDLIKAQSNQLGVSPGSNPQETAQTNNLRNLANKKAQIESSFKSLQDFIEGMKQKYNVKIEPDPTPDPKFDDKIKETKDKIVKAKTAIVKEVKKAFAPGMEASDIDVAFIEAQAKIIQAEYQKAVDEIGPVEFNTQIVVEEPNGQKGGQKPLSDNNQNIAKITKEIDNELALHSTGINRRIELERAKYDKIEGFLNDEAKANERAYQLMLISLKEYQDKQEEINENGTTNKINRANFEKDLEKIKIEAMKQIAQEALNFLSDIANLMNQADQKQLRQELAVIDQKKKNQDYLLKSKRISQSEYNKQIEKLDAEAKKKQHDSDVKALNRQKSLQTASAIMNTAQGIATAFGTYPFPYSAIVAALVGAAGAVQIAAIQNQEVPVAEKGMLIGGNRHSDGGTLIEAEKGEMILSRNTVANNPELASALLFSSQNRNGASIGFNWSNPSVSSGNVLAATSTSSRSNNSNNNGGSNDETNMLIRALIKEQQLNNGLVANYPTQLTSKVMIQDINKANDLLTSIKTEGGLKQ